jgi:hypothetical protein
MGQFTAKEKLQVLERELRIRLCVYPDRIRKGRMKQADADYQIAVLREIVRDYEFIADRRN